MIPHDSYNLSMVFDKTPEWDFDRIKITHRMLLILAHIDGLRTLAELEENLNLQYEDLFSDLQKLHGMQLIKIIPPQHEKQPTSSRVKKPRTGCYRGTYYEY